MANLIFSLNATLPIFLVMMAGWTFRQLGIISDSFASQMNKFVFQIALPVSLFTQLDDIDLAREWDTGYVLFCFAATLSSILAAALLSYFFAEKGDRAEFVQGSYRSSASLLGMAYIEMIYGTSSTGALMMLGCVPLYNVAAVLILSAGKGQKLTGSELRKTLVRIITNPIILGIMLGFLFSAMKLSLPEFLETSLGYVGRLASPMGLLSMGAAMDFRKMFGKVKPALCGTFLKLAGFTAAILPLAVHMGFTGEKLVAALIMLGSPATVAGYIMAKNMGHEGTLSASIVVTTTLLSSVTLTLWLWLLRSGGLI